jgi:hypothetical protein
MKSILVFSHNHNTFDKKKLLENPHPDFLKPSSKTVDMFITQEKEAFIKDFFLNKIDDLLSKYEPGDPKMKPDVIKQTKEIEEERKKMMQQHQQSSNMTSIMISKDGGAPTALSSEEALDIMNSQKNDIENLVKQNQELQKIVVQLQQQLIQNNPVPPPPPNGEIVFLKKRIEELERQLQSTKPREEKEENRINIDMGRPKSEPEV